MKNYTKNYTINAGLIEEFMAERSLSRVKFSRLCGICERTLVRILKSHGEESIRLLTLLRLANGMGVRVSELLIVS